MNKKLLIFIVLLLIVSFSTKAFASLTFTANAITGTTASSIDLGTGNTLSLQTTSNGAINLGSGLLTSIGSAIFSGTVKGLNVYEDGDGDKNIALGSTAFKRTATGYDNLSLGYDSMFSITDGNYNIAVGNVALYGNTSGQKNVAIGYNALASNNTGGNNIALGYNALVSNTNGQYNIAIGDSALGTQSGTENIAIGFSALSSLGESWNNIAIGSEAGKRTGASPSNSNALTTGYYNTFIGYRAGLNSSTQRNNTTVIGNSAYVNADNTVVFGDQNVTDVFAGSAKQAKVTASAFYLSALQTAPANATVACVAGEIRVAAAYIYVCSATNTWVRAALTTW